MHSIDRRSCLGLLASLIASPGASWSTRSQETKEAAEQAQTRFAGERLRTGGKELAGRPTFLPDAVELQIEGRRRSLALRKLKTLELELRTASGSPVEEDARLEELVPQLLRDPRDTASIEAWLELLRQGYSSATPLGPPLLGEVWICPDPTRHHAVHAASAFALDYAVLDKKRRVHSGAGKTNEEYASWDAPLIAVADGRVRRARDDQADDETYKGVADPKRANDLVLDFEGGQAFYQHLKQGSLLVKPGQEVRRGDELARVGNSGNASWPHLHFAVYESFGRGSLSVPIQTEEYVLSGLKSDVSSKPKRLDVPCRNVPLQEGWVVRFA